MCTQILINAKDSKNAKAIVEMMLESATIVPQLAMVRYNTASCSKKANYDRGYIYPLEMECMMDGGIVNVKVDGVTAGNEKESSRDLVEILEKTKMDFEKDDILTTRCINEHSGYICKIYSRKDS